ncbi:hypothetical protein NDU88_006237 [Pleurodeles waltl]|uniref:Uncharacterized protein n=1 Tax=Pleurodeles waltl TaxID=8319 RepID=A0AAV7UL09_PLEWA|nr:hypothetical protein NDU88_006237 [Pleurodeles waltl]
MRADMRVELEKLVNDGVIEEVEGTDWLAPVVIARKSSTEGSDAVSGRNTKLIVVLQEFNFIVDYTPGIKNKVADTLSRLVESVEGDNEGDIENEEDSVGEDVCAIEGSAVSEDKWRKATLEDEVLQTVFEMLKFGVSL